MSKLVIYAVYDKAVGAYMRPFPMQSDGQATRHFQDEAIRADSPIANHPEDFSIFRVGMFDDQKGELTYEEPTCLARAHELIALARKVDKEKMQLMNESPGGTN